MKRWSDRSFSQPNAVEVEIPPLATNTAHNQRFQLFQVPQRRRQVPQSIEATLMSTILGQLVISADSTR